MSCAVHAPGCSMLGWAYVRALLNDLFGLQARGGCLCAGPYAQALLGLTPSDAAALEAALVDWAELQPGVVRLAQPFYATPAAAAFAAAMRSEGAWLWCWARGRG